MTAFNDTFGIIGFSSENVGIDRRIYTGLTSTNPQLNVSYNGGRVDVYLNGVKLMGNHSGQSNYDYTYQSTGSGSAITLSTGVALVATDTIECVGYVSNSSNTVTTYTPSVSAGNNTFTSISHTSSDLLNVFLNGVLLDSSDYTADASADTVAITSLASGDVVHIQVIGALDNSNFVPAGGGTFSGNVAVNADLTVDTNTLKVDSTNNAIGIGTASPSSVDLLTLGDGTAVNDQGLRIHSNRPMLRLSEEDTTDENWQIEGQGGTFIINKQNDAFNSVTSTLKIDSSGNTKFNSGFGSVATVYGCRAWVNFDGTGTVAIRQSGNVSSITDNGTGNYTINFSTAMPDANYSIVGTAKGDGSLNADNQLYTGHLQPATLGNITTGSVGILVSRNLSGGESDSSFDSQIISVAIFR